MGAVIHANLSRPSLGSNVNCRDEVTSDLNVFLQLLGVGEAAVPGAAVGDEPGDGLRLVGRHVDAAHRRVPAHVLVVVLRRK